MRGRAKRTGSPCMPQAPTLHSSKAAGLSQSFSHLIMYMKKITRF